MLFPHLLLCESGIMYVCEQVFGNLLKKKKKQLYYTEP